MLLEDLIKDQDIVCIQEHWLFNFDTGFLHKIVQANNNDYVIRCVDDIDPIPLYQRPRGFGGTATIWKKELFNKIQIQILPDGSDRVLPIVINCHPVPICLINVYLPCRGNHSEGEFQDSTHKHYRGPG